MPNEFQPSPPEGRQSPFERIRRTNPAGVEFWLWQACYLAMQNADPGKEIVALGPAARL